jgi:hypothetical protein
MVSELAPEASAGCYIAIVVFDWLFLIAVVVFLYDFFILNRLGIPDHRFY